MPSAPVDTPEEPVADRTDPRAVLRRSLVKGTAILLPLVVTLFVISIVLGFIFQQLSPVINAVTGTRVVNSEVLAGVATVTVFVLLVLLIGFLAEFAPGDHQFSEDLDHFMASIPGIGSVYTSFNEMTELMLDSDTDSFQEVKLVEYPGEDSYVVAFKTAETPEVIARDTGNEDMITLFMPMAPNPVMGGFVIHVSRERVVDVDLSVEEGIRSIVTSGVAIGGDAESMPGATEKRLRTLGDLDDTETVVGVDATPDPTRADVESTESADPESAESADGRDAAGDDATADGDR